MDIDSVSKRFRLIDRWFLAFVAIAATGCDSLIPPRPPIGVPADTPTAKVEENVEPVVVVEAPGERFGGNWEAWYVYKAGGQIIGRTHLRASARIDSESIRTGDPEVLFERDERLMYRNGSIQFTQQTETSSVESFDGSLRSFEIETLAGPLATLYQGTVQKETLRIGVLRGQERDSRQLTWDSTTRGLFALEQSLRRRPMQTGETRRLRVAVPTLDAIGLSVLQCTGQASVPMLEGDFQVLTEIEMEVLDAENRLVDQMLIWVDERGLIQKSLRPSIRLESYRVSSAKAKTLFPDQNGEVRVWLSGQLDLTKNPSLVAMLAQSAGEVDQQDGDRAVDAGDAESPEKKSILSTLFQPAQRQSVRSGQSGVQVLYSAGQPPDGFEVFESTVRPSDTAATELLDYAQSDVARLSKAVGELSGESLLVELVSIGNNVLSIAPQQGIRRASTVIRSGRGGELDHTLVLAALLRSRAIPARVVLGLRPVESEAVDGSVPMRLSSWVLASIDNEWITVDPLRKLENEFRITLRVCEGDDDLSETIVEVFQNIANVSIEVRGVRYPDEE